MKLLYLLLGISSFGLGILGVFLPVLPTTPLLLLSIYCLARSSNTLKQKVENSHYYQIYAKDFIEHHSMSMTRKIQLLSLASIMLLFPLITLSSLWKILILFVYIYLYYYFFFRIKTSY